MGVYKYLNDFWKSAENKTLLKKRMQLWRKQSSTLRIEKPSRLNRARALGYKAKKGIFIVRQKVKRGGHFKSWIGGRRSKNMQTRINLRKTYKLIAEERANKKYPNCEVLNSYFVSKDGKQYWFEIIMVDRNHPEVLAEKNLKWIESKKGRVFRGLTSEGKRVRGLRWKGKGAEKARPSRRAKKRRQ